MKLTRVYKHDNVIYRVAVRTEDGANYEADVAFMDSKPVVTMDLSAAELHYGTLNGRQGFLSSNSTRTEVEGLIENFMQKNRF